VFVFLGLTVISYGQQLQMVLLDRHNGRVIVKLSESELRASEDPLADMAKRRALLNSRRRVLESLLKAEPTVYSMVTLIVCLMILGHPVAAVVLTLFVIVSFFLYPHMQRTFDRYVLPEEEDEESGAIETVQPSETSTSDPNAQNGVTADTELSHTERVARRIQSRRDRAERNLQDSAERMFMIINRPLIRLKVGWPILTAAAASVAAMAALTIHDMGSAGELPQKATLLILLLALTSRTCLQTAQNLEDLAFFASMLEGVKHSEDGREKL
jgi:hypothetical protein